MDRLPIGTPVNIKGFVDDIPHAVIVGGYEASSRLKYTKTIFRYIVKVFDCGTITKAGEEQLAKYTYLTEKLLTRLYIIDREELEVVSGNSGQEESGSHKDNTKKTQR